MNHDKRQLMRLLHGELTTEEAAQLEARIEGDDELRAAYEHLASTWHSLELPTPQPVPLEFSNKIGAAAKQQLELGLGPLPAPRWFRTVAATALSTGIILGLLLGGTFSEAGLTADSALQAGVFQVDGLKVESLQAELDLGPLSLAEIYWLSVDDQELLFTESATDEAPATTTSPGGSVP